MGELMFGGGAGHMDTEKVEAVTPAGVSLVNYTDERGAEQHWFTGPNLGYPFDDALAKETMEAVDAAGLAPTKECPVCEASVCDDEDCTDENCYPMANCEHCGQTGRVPLDFDPNE